MAISVMEVCSIYKGGSLHGTILLTQGYYCHWGTHLNAMKKLFVYL